MKKDLGNPLRSLVGYNDAPKPPTEKVLENILDGMAEFGGTYWWIGAILFAAGICFALKSVISLGDSAISERKIILYFILWLIFEVVGVSIICNHISVMSAQHES